jgi:hypothetical protein
VSSLSLLLESNGYAFTAFVPTHQNDVSMPTHTLDLTFAVAASDLREAKDFLTFLRRAARKHSVNMTTSVSGTEVTLSVQRTQSENVSLFLQDLILTRGLHYYLCGVSHRRHVASAVVKPIAEELLESCSRSSTRCSTANPPCRTLWLTLWRHLRTPSTAGQRVMRPAY